MDTNETAALRHTPGPGDAQDSSGPDPDIVDQVLALIARHVRAGTNHPTALHAKQTARPPGDGEQPEPERHAADDLLARLIAATERRERDPIEVTPRCSQPSGVPGRSTTRPTPKWNSSARKPSRPATTDTATNAQPISENSSGNTCAVSWPTSATSTDPAKPLRGSTDLACRC